jgi:nicotinamidase-related amidase
MAIWDDVIPEEDLQMLARGKYGEKVGFGKKPAIIVVDMIYRFLDESYPFGTCAKMGWPAAHAIKKLLDKGRETGTPIFFFKSLIGRTPAERGRWKHLRWLGSKVLDTEEYQKTFDPREDQIIEEIQPRSDEVVITKPFISGFFGTNLVSMLIFHNVDTLIVAGIVTSGCVRATVVDAFQYDFRTIVPEECVGDRSTMSHKVSLFEMQMKYADVVPLTDVINYLDEIEHQNI